MSANPNNPTGGLAGHPPSVAPKNTGQGGNFSLPGAQHRDLETLLALSSLHEQVRRRRTQELNKGGRLAPGDRWELKQFADNEVLQLIADRALTVTGADGVAVALVDGSGIVCRASAGEIAPEKGARLDPYSGFSGACLRTGSIVRCDDSERDGRVDSEACRKLGTRSMVAVPLTTPQAIIGMLEAFSTEPFGFNDSDVRSLSLLSELILDAMKPEEENRLADLSQQVMSPRPVSDARQLSPLVSGALSVNVEPQIVAKVAPLDLPVSQKATLPPAKRDSEEFKQNAKLVFFSDYDQSDNSRPGLSLVIVLVLLAGCLGAGLWWQIRHNVGVGVPRRTESSVIRPPATPSQALPPNSNQQPLATPDIADSTEQSETPADSGPANAEGKTLYPVITGIRHWSSANSSTVVIDLEDQVQYEAHRLTNPERIYFDLLDTRLAQGLFGKIIEINDPVLQRVRIAQPKEGVTRVVLDTKGASNYSVSMEEEPFRLEVEVGKLGSKLGPSSKVSLFGADQNVAADLRNVPLPGAKAAIENSPLGKAQNVPDSSKTNPPAKIAGPVIVLDAGHGGWDLGTVGNRGLEEKDLVLDIVQRLGSMLEQKLSAKIIYTRLDDSYVALEKRAEIANLSQANLFLSVHANYSGSASARGVETYYTNTYSSVKARPADSGVESVFQNIDWTKVDIREKVQESHHLAECVQQSLYSAVAAKNPGIRNRGVKEAQYVVLMGTSMPAILAEVSFVSSPTDETELESAAYRQRIAEALYKGIARYRETPRRTALASLMARPGGR